MNLRKNLDTTERCWVQLAEYNGYSVKILDNSFEGESNDEIIGEISI